MSIIISGTTGIDAGSLPVNNCGNTEVEGNLNLSGVGTRITGDFSNTTASNRVAFQTSTLNGYTQLDVLPNGTSQISQIQVDNNSDATNASVTGIGVNTTDSRVFAGRNGTGTYLPLTFYTNGSEKMRIDTSGNVGIGVIPSVWRTTQKVIEFQSGSISSFNNLNNINITSNAYISASNQNVYKQDGYAARYQLNEGLHQWYTAPSGTAGNTITFTNLMTLDTNGNLLLQSGTGGLGYGTGAGGLVTQLISKSTAVTLNKPTGLIIMNNAALAAGATVEFILNNSLISPNDTVNVNLNNLNAAGYNVWATSGNNGISVIRVKNVIGSSLSDALPIQFSILKGAQS